MTYNGSVPMDTTTSVVRALIMRHSCPIIFSLFLWQPLLFAETPGLTSLTPASLVPAALEKLDATNLDEDWSFTMEVIDGDKLQIIKSDPARESYNRRQLITVDGEVPDDERLEAFREAEEKRIDDLDPEASGYGYMVDTDTLELIESSEAYTTFSFVPRVKAMADDRDRLRGTLVLNTHSGQIEKLEIQNTEKLSPVFSVTVDTYRLALFFQQEQGENLLMKLESLAVGKAVFVKRFDSQVEVAFSDYRRTMP
jgi:hypothetical protein